jgi:hypothetical protein
MAKKQSLLAQSIAQLNSHRVVKAPAVKNQSVASLAAAAAQIITQGGVPALMPTMELSARHPYDPAGRMDVYMPGRWDCKYDLLFMDALVTGPGSGEWNGTICYVTFTTPANGNYLVAANFSGYQITMRLAGPWGESTAYSATPSAHTAVTSLWTGSAGELLEFSLHCTGGGVIGYLKSVQIFLLS